MSIRLPSASALDRAMHCAASEVLPAVRIETENARDGNWKHDVWRKLHLGIDEAVKEAPEEHRAEALAMEDTWSPPEGAEYEVALAYNPKTGEGRRLKKEHHRDYSDRRDGEMVATIDAGYVTDAQIAAVVDFKSGHGHVPRAQDNWQLKLGALAWAAATGKQAAEVAIVKPGAKPYFASLDALELSFAQSDLQALEKRIYGAQQALEREETPHLSVGDWCRYCPARLRCPAQTALVRRLATEPADWAADMKRDLSPESAGLAWSRLELAKRALGEVEGALRMYAKDYPLVLPDGRQLRLKATTSETLDGGKTFDALAVRWGFDVARKGAELEASKASVRRALRQVYEEAKRSGTKTTLAALETEALGLVRAAGGVVPKERLEMVDDRPALEAAVAGGAQ